MNAPSASTRRRGREVHVEPGKKGASAMAKLPRDPSKLFCEPCAQMTQHEVGAFTDGSAMSRYVCKECGCRKVGGQTLALKRLTHSDSE
jgi:hypothetical protein